MKIWDKLLYFWFIKNIGLQLQFASQIEMIFFFSLTVELK